MAKKVDRNNLEMKSHEEAKKKDVVERIAEMFPVEEGWLVHHELNQCPYCGDEMGLGFAGPEENHYAYIAYICPSCGSRTPVFHTDISLINEEKLNRCIEKTVKLISNGLKNRKEEA